MQQEERPRRQKQDFTSGADPCLPFPLRLVLAGASIRTEGQADLNVGNDLTVTTITQRNGMVASLTRWDQARHFGSSIKAGGDLGLHATGDVSITHATEQYYDMSFKRKKGFRSSSSILTRSGGTTSAGSILSGNNITIQAGDNVLITASGGPRGATSASGPKAATSSPTRPRTPTGARRRKTKANSASVSARAA